MTIDDDKTYLQINLTHEQIKKLSKLKFKKMIRKKVKDKAFNYLQSLKSIQK